VSEVDFELWRLPKVLFTSIKSLSEHCNPALVLRSGGSASTRAARIGGEHVLTSSPLAMLEWAVGKKESREVERARF
jgi:hypothetical protein